MHPEGLVLRYLCPPLSFQLAQQATAGEVCNISNSLHFFIYLTICHQSFDIYVYKTTDDHSLYHVAF